MEITLRNEKIEHELQNITNRIDSLIVKIRPESESDGKLFSSVAKRLADTEARLEKLESLLIRKTPAGDIKLSERGKEVAVQWYQRQ